MLIRSLLHLALVGLTLGFAGPSVEAAQSVTLAWDPSPDPSVVGYRVWYGTTSGAYNQVVDVGALTMATVDGLMEGLTYFFVVTAYNQERVESLPSDEVSYTVPQVVLSPNPSVVGYSSDSGTVSVTLGWDPSQDTRVAGYSVHYGTASGVHDQAVDVGAAATATLNGLAEGQTYFFVLVAYDQQHLEFEPSAEVAYTAPTAGAEPVSGVLRMLPQVGTNRAPRLQFQVPPTRPYVVLASEDLRSWAPIHQGVSESVDWIEWTDPKAARLPKRFYRLMLPDQPLVPGVLSILPAAVPEGAIGLRPSVLPGQRYQIQASEDLVTWTTRHEGICASNQPMDFVDSQAGLFPKRFYRLALPDTPPAPATLRILRGGIVHGARLRVAAWEGQHYRIQASEDLATWATIYEGISDSGEAVDLVDPEAALHPKRFYRLVFD